MPALGIHPTETSLSTTIHGVFVCARPKMKTDQRPSRMMLRPAGQGHVPEWHPARRGNTHWSTQQHGYITGHRSQSQRTACSGFHPQDILKGTQLLGQRSHKCWPGLGLGRCDCKQPFPPPCLFEQLSTQSQPWKGFAFLEHTNSSSGGRHFPSCGLPGSHRPLPRRAAAGSPLQPLSSGLAPSPVAAGVLSLGDSWPGEKVPGLMTLSRSQW